MDVRYTTYYELADGRVEVPMCEWSKHRRGGPVWHATLADFADSFGRVKAHTWKTQAGAEANVSKYDPRHLADFARTVERGVLRLTWSQTDEQDEWGHRAWGWQVTDRLPMDYPYSRDPELADEPEPAERAWARIFRELADELERGEKTVERNDFYCDERGGVSVYILRYGDPRVLKTAVDFLTEADVDAMAEEQGRG